MPTNNSGATVYNNLQSDMHIPWYAPIGGPVAFIEELVVMVAMTVDVVIGADVVTVSFSVMKCLCIIVSATQLQLLYI